MPEPGDRDIQAEFSTAAVKLTFSNPRSDPSGRIFSETYFIKGFLNPVAAPATSDNMSFTPESGDRSMACGSLKTTMKGQKDLDPSKSVRRVYVTRDMEAVHPDDLGRYLPSDCDFGWLLIGNDCARILGMEWTLPEIVA